MDGWHPTLRFPWDEQVDNAQRKRLRLETMKRHGGGTEGHKALVRSRKNTRKSVGVELKVFCARLPQPELHHGWLDNEFSVGLLQNCHIICQNGQAAFTQRHCCG